MAEPWPTLLTFSVSLVLLYLAQRWITQHVQGVGVLLFNSRDAGMALLWLLLLPGIIVHEISHWLMARLLRLRTGRVQVWPQMKGKAIVLGSVEIQKTNPLWDSLVGLAPFLSGTLLLWWIGYSAFDAATLGWAWQRQAWGEIAHLLQDFLQVPDSWLWLYLMMAISNAMMPSATDRESWRLLLIYLVGAAGVLVFLGWWPSSSTGVVSQLSVGMQTLSYVFILTLAIDLFFISAIALIELLVGWLRGGRIVYRS